jgi:hypothetical protein
MEWLKAKTKKENIKVCFFGNNIGEDLVKGWDFIGVIPEMMMVKAGGSVDKRMCSDDWFLEKDEHDIVKRDFYMCEVEKVARYVVSQISDISDMIETKQASPSPYLLNRATGVLKFGETLPPKNTQKQPTEG